MWISGGLLESNIFARLFEVLEKWVFGQRGAVYLEAGRA